jgi:uncharacterized membrane protein
MLSPCGPTGPQWAMTFAVPSGATKSALGVEGFCRKRGDSPVSKGKRRRQKRQPPLPASLGHHVPQPIPQPVHHPSGELIQAGLAVSATSFSGPLPPPEILARYDQVIPGAAKKIIGMADRQSRHRQSLERLVIESDVRRSKTGLRAGLAVCLTGILVGGSLVYLGHDAAGAAITAVPTAGLIGVFVYGTASRRREREEKTDKLTKGKKR